MQYYGAGVPLNAAGVAGNGAPFTQIEKKGKGGE